MTYSNTIYPSVGTTRSSDPVDELHLSKRVAQLHMAHNVLKREGMTSTTKTSLPEVAKSLLTRMRAVHNLIQNCQPEATRKACSNSELVGDTSGSGKNAAQLAQTLGLPEAMVPSVVPKVCDSRNTMEAELQVCKQQISGLMNASLCGLPSSMVASIQQHPQAALDEVGDVIGNCIGRLAMLVGDSPEGVSCNSTELLCRGDDSVVEQLDAAGDLVERSLNAQAELSNQGAAALDALRAAKSCLVSEQQAGDAPPKFSDEISTMGSLTEEPSGVIRASDENSTIESDTRDSSKQEGDTLQFHLKLLELEDPLCVLSVRKINRLGFDSKAILERHFAWHGVATKVLVAHLKVKQAGHRPARLRPAGLGFVVMASREHAVNVLKQGDSQMIGDIEITVQPFQKPDVSLD